MSLTSMERNRRPVALDRFAIVRIDGAPFGVEIEAAEDVASTVIFTGRRLPKEQYGQWRGYEASIFARFNTFSEMQEALAEAETRWFELTAVVEQAQAVVEAAIRTRRAIWEREVRAMDHLHDDLRYA